MKAPHQPLTPNWPLWPRLSLTPKWPLWPHLFCTPLFLFLLLATGCSTGSRRSGSSAAAGVSAPPPGATSTAPQIRGIRWPGAQAGETVRIIGRNFDTSPAGVVVHFPNNVDINVAPVSDVEIKVDVPAGVVSGSVTVTSGGQTTNPYPFTMWLIATASVDDHGNDRGSATPITLGQRVPAVVNFVRDEDWFSVSLMAGVAYSIRTLDLSHAVDTIIYLHDGSSQIDLNTDYVGLGYGSGIDFTPTTSGTYFVSAKQWRLNADVGTYSLIVDLASNPLPPSATNTAAQVETLPPPTGVQSDAVTIEYQVNDPDGDDLEVLVFWREWNPIHTEYKPATIHALSDPVSGVSSASSTRVYRFVWDSRADVGNGGGTFQLEFQGADGTTLGALDDSGTFQLVNPVLPGGGTGAGAPVVQSVGTPTGTQTGAVLIPYAVSDAQGDPVQVEGHYMLDAITGFQRASAHITSDPTTNVATTAGGLPYRFVWDSQADLGSGAFPNVIFQIRANDGQAATPRTTGNFQVQN